MAEQWGLNKLPLSGGSFLIFPVRVYYTHTLYRNPPDFRGFHLIHIG